MKVNKRSLKLPNEILKDENIATMNLYNKKGEVVAFTIFDVEHIEKINKRKWYLTNMGYVVSGCGGDCLLFHRVIMDCPVGKYIDHIDRNPLNNQSDNLRITTNQINNLNKGLYSTNTSGYTGVVWDKSRSKWMAQFSIGKNKNINLGRYDKIEDAVIAREKFFNSYLREAEKNA